MNADDFVFAIEKYVMEYAVDITMKNVKSPPGRSVPKDKVARSAWFNALTDNEVEMITSLVQDAASEAAFGFLTVLDGVRVIDDAKGRFVLYYETGTGRELVKSADVDLHDLFSN